MKNVFTKTFFGAALALGLMCCSVTLAYAQSITVTSSLSAFTAEANSGASVAQSFTVSGTALTDNITLTAPSGYEISFSPTDCFVSSLTLVNNNGTVPTSTIYARMTGGTSANGSVTGDITAASTGATTQNAALTGSIIAALSGNWKYIAGSACLTGDAWNNGGNGAAGITMTGFPRTITFYNKTQTEGDSRFRIQNGGWDQSHGWSISNNGACAIGVTLSDYSADDNIRIDWSGAKNITITYDGSLICVTATTATGATPLAAGDYSYSPNTANWDGSPKSVNVTGQAAGGITVKYNGSTTVPTAIGTYKITIDVAANSTYRGETGLCLGDFIIKEPCSDADTKTIQASVNGGCPGYTTTLSVENPQPSVTYEFFDGATSLGTGTGTSLVDYAVNAAKTITVKSVEGGGICTTTVGTVSLTVAAAPAAPTVTSPYCRGDISGAITSSTTNAYWQTTAEGTSTANPATSAYYKNTGTAYLRNFDGTCWSDAAEVTVISQQVGVEAPTYTVVTLQDKSECNAATDYLYDNNGTLATRASNSDNASQWFQIPAETGYFYYKNRSTGRYIYYPGGSTSCGGTGNWAIYNNVLTGTAPVGSADSNYEWSWSETGGCGDGIPKTFMANKTTGKDLTGANGRGAFCNTVPGLAYDQHQHNTYQIKRTETGTAKDGADIPGLDCPFPAVTLTPDENIKLRNASITLTAAGTDIPADATYEFLAAVDAGEYEVILSTDDEALYTPDEAGTYHFIVKIYDANGIYITESAIADVEVKEPLVIRVKRPSTWGNDMVIYVWKDGSDGTWYEMDIDSDCANWYYYTITFAGINPANVMFGNFSADAGNDPSFDWDANNLNLSCQEMNITENKRFEIDEVTGSHNCNDRHGLVDVTSTAPEYSETGIIIAAKYPSWWSYTGSSSLYIKITNGLCGTGGYVPMEPICTQSGESWWKYKVNQTPVKFIISPLADGGAQIWDRTYEYGNLTALNTDLITGITENSGGNPRGFESASLPAGCTITGIEEQSSGSLSEAVIYVQNRQIFVVGTENFKVYNLLGSEVQNKNLLQGVYIIRLSDNTTHKVLVNF
jgi:hypothetical protein